MKLMRRPIPEKKASLGNVFDDIVSAEMRQELKLSPGVQFQICTDDGKPLVMPEQQRRRLLMRPEIADHGPATWVEYPGLRSEVQYFCDGCGAEIGFDEGRNVCGNNDLGVQFLQEHWADLGIIEGDEEEVFPVNQLTGKETNND